MGSPEKPGKLFIVSGASGTGKTTLCRALEKDLGLFFSVSATTRPKRSGEVEGVDYTFLTQDQFQDMIQKGEFLEWAEVHGNYYGTPRVPIESRLNKGENVLLDLDTQGALKLKDERDDVLTVFLRPPSFQALRERLVGRGTDPVDVIQRRIKKAEDEIKLSDRYDFVLVNEDLDETRDELKNILSGKIAP